jgi:hypothetical protein
LYSQHPAQFSQQNINSIQKNTNIPTTTMQLKNSCNNTKVFNHPLVGKQNALSDFLLDFLLAQKKMAELEPLCLVVMECNSSTGPQDKKEVPHPL